MENFRQFELTDPFGVTWKVLFKWLQTAISLRHSDSVDAKFAMGDNGTQLEKVISMAHPDLLRLSRETGEEITDPRCARLAALHLKHVVETGEDLEKELIEVPYGRLLEYAGVLRSRQKSAA